MELKKKITVNIVAQVYIAGTGIIVTPIYLKLMGPEAYGLIGIFTLIQAIFNILDLGLTPTLARETARARGSEKSKSEYFDILSAIKKIFIVISISGCLALVIGTDFIVNNWLKIKQLDKFEVQQALVAIAVCVSLRWMSGLYRASITGFEEFQWLSYWNIFITTLRFLIVIPILYITEGSFVVFFVYQVAIACLEIYGLANKSQRLIRCNLGENNSSRHANPMQAIRPLMGFSGGVAFTSAIWALITQTDKIVLSKLLTLTDYGYFSIGVLLASGITVIGGPITSTAIPKFALLYSTQDIVGMKFIYRKISQYTSIAVIPATLILCFFHAQIIEIWTGDSIAAERSGYVLAFYAAGNCLMTIASLPLLLQYAEGKLKLHVIGNTLYALILYPTLVWSVSIYGISGACWSWLIVNSLSFLFWTPIVHRNFFKNEHFNWLWNDIIKVIFFPFIVIVTAKIIVPLTDDKLLNSISIITIYFAALLFSPIVIKFFSKIILLKFRFLNNK